eukprot:5010084-Amphidinium_carterae.2
MSAHELYLEGEGAHFVAMVGLMSTLVVLNACHLRPTLRVTLSQNKAWAWCALTSSLLDVLNMELDA